MYDEFPKREKPQKTPEQALLRLMDLCVGSEKCSNSCRQLLYRWGVERAEHDQIVKRLEAERFVDDARYAAAYTREKSNLSKWGTHKIAASLRTKRISEDIIADALSQIDRTADIGKLNDHLKRKMRTVKYKDQYDLRGKLLRYGIGLGFDYRSVTEAIESLTPDGDQDY